MSSATAILDLLDVPYAVADCYVLTQLAARRYGRAVPEIGAEARGSVSCGDSIAALVPAAEEVSAELAQPGDVALYGPRDSRDVTGCACVVAPGLVLRTSAESGPGLATFEALRGRLRRIVRFPLCE